MALLAQKEGLWKVDKRAGYSLLISRLRIHEILYSFSLFTFIGSRSVAGSLSLPLKKFGNICVCIVFRIT